jgi:hypothetical protein
MKRAAMNRAHRHTVSSALLVLFGALLQQGTGCGSVTGTCGGASCFAGTGADTGTGGTAASCQLDPAASTFTFHIHNGGTKSLRLPVGCGATLPITVDTSGGSLPIGPGGLSSCDYTCDQVNAGDAAPGCGDCGDGVSDDLGPGVTADIQWDRRVFVASTSDAMCTAGGETDPCAQGTAVAPTTAQTGVLSLCADGLVAPMGDVGACSGESTPLSFTVDTTKAEATIEVQ